jgi:hypothetical protein
VHGEFEGLRLGRHRRYEPIPPTVDGLRWSEVLELYLGVTDCVLRYFDADGELVPTPPESALAERARADQAQQWAESERERADAEHLRAERLAARLRELGIDPDDGA